MIPKDLPNFIGEASPTKFGQGAPKDILSPTLKRKPELSGNSTELLALRETVMMLNNPLITGAQVTPEAKTSNQEILSGPADRNGATFIASDPAITSTEKSPAPSPEKLAPSLAAAPGKIFFTGRLAVGKDFCASAAGLAIHGFADPIYFLARHFFGVNVTANEGKDAPGMRAFLQTVGQWGRGTTTPEYPLTPARATFITMVRSLAAASLLDDSFGVDWQSYGTNENLWLDAALKKIGDAKGVAITNVRFVNEFKRLIDSGWQHWHIMASPTAWKNRLLKKGIDAASPAIKDLSEKLANDLDNQVIKTLSAHKTGAKLRVIWNDTETPCPARLNTLAEFLRVVNQPMTSQVQTGE